MTAGCLLVALGGGLGALGRYLLSLAPLSAHFPFATLLTNFLGAVAIGMVTQTAEQLSLPQGWILFLKTGLCGGFTTFSTFSLESVVLLEQRRYAVGAGYISASVVLCLAGVVLGRWLSRTLLFFCHSH